MNLNTMFKLASVVMLFGTDSFAMNNISNNELSQNEFVRLSEINTNVSNIANLPSREIICMHESLIEYAQQGNLGVVKDLIRRGCNMNFQNKYGQTALLAVVDHMDLQYHVMAYLLDQGVNVFVKNQYGSTVLARYCDKDHADLNIVKLLIEQAKKNIQQIFGCNEDVINYLIKAYINDKDMWGGTALMSAAARGNLEIVKYLVEHGADINCRYTEQWGGDDAISLAGQYKHMDVVEYLKGQCASFDQQ